MTANPPASLIRRVNPFSWDLWLLLVGSIGVSALVMLYLGVWHPGQNNSSRSLCAAPACGDDVVRQQHRRPTEAAPRNAEPLPRTAEKEVPGGNEFTEHMRVTESGKHVVTAASILAAFLAVGDYMPKTTQGRLFAMGGSFSTQVRARLQSWPYPAVSATPGIIVSPPPVATTHSHV